MSFAIRKVPLPPPTVAPIAPKSQLSETLIRLKPGESVHLAMKAGQARQTAQRVVLKLAENAGDMSYAFLVWHANADGSASQTGKDFSIVARVTRKDAEKYGAAAIMAREAEQTAKSA